MLEDGIKGGWAYWRVGRRLSRGQADRATLLDELLALQLRLSSRHSTAYNMADVRNFLIERKMEKGRKGVGMGADRKIEMGNGQTQAGEMKRKETFALK